MKRILQIVIFWIILPLGGYSQLTDPADVQTYHNVQREKRLQNQEQQKVKLKPVSDEKFGYQLIRKRRITSKHFQASK